MSYFPQSYLSGDLITAIKNDSVYKVVDVQYSNRYNSIEIMLTKKGAYGKYFVDTYHLDKIDLISGVNITDTSDEMVGNISKKHKWIGMA